MLGSFVVLREWTIEWGARLVEGGLAVSTSCPGNFPLEFLLLFWVWMQRSSGFKPCSVPLRFLEVEPEELRPAGGDCEEVVPMEATCASTLWFVRRDH